MPPIATTDLRSASSSSSSLPSSSQTRGMSDPVPSSGAVQRPSTYLSTEPPSDHHWRITLEHKVIAITGACRGIGLGIAEVCLANAAAHIYSLDLFEPTPDNAEYQAVSKKYPG